MSIVGTCRQLIEATGASVIRDGDHVTVYRGTAYFADERGVYCSVPVARDGTIWRPTSSVIIDEGEGAVLPADAATFECEDGLVAI